MIEVEIRGILSRDEYTRLQKFLKEKGKHIESHKREMILLTELPGYSHNLSEREVDIRIRNTNGVCELMVKHKASKDNSSRKEMSVPLASLDAGKELARAFGCTKGVWMYRKKEMYKYHDIEWSLVEAPNSIFYYEAESTTEDASQVPELHKKLVEEAKTLDLSVLTSSETDEFIEKLNREVNKEITL